MRYAGVDRVIFLNADRKYYTIMGFREIPSYETAFVLDVDASSMLDEIASRSDVYGAGNEDLAYKLFEANIVSFVDNRFDISKIRKLNIPT